MGDGWVGCVTGVVSLHTYISVRDFAVLAISTKLAVVPAEANRRRLLPVNDPFHIYPSEYNHLESFANDNLIYDPYYYYSYYEVD